MIALILGGAPSVWRDVGRARNHLAGRPYMAVAANLAGISYPDRLDGWCTLHPDHLDAWRARRTGNADYRSFVPDSRFKPEAELVAERWPGSSGLYAVQIALFNLGASAAILCGVPLEQEAGHFDRPGPWARPFSYRHAFKLATPIIGPRTRSMGGWTAEHFGQPDPAWIEAVSDADPLGVTPEPERTAMHKVENAGKTMQRFHERPAAGGGLVRLAPGESGTFDIDPKQARFQGGDLKVSEVKAKPAPKPEPDKA